MQNNMLVFIRTQILGWEQGDMIAVRKAAEGGSDEDLQSAVAAAIHNLTWAGSRPDQFGSLPYHHQMQMAARVQEATETVLRTLPGDLKFVWRFVIPEVCLDEIAFAKARNRPSSTFVVAEMKAGGVYRPIEAVFH